MTPTTELRRTPLRAAHLALGARLVDFHGWELPLHYGSIIKEHQAVRARCGLFDVSHMGQVLVEGPGALELLQRVNSNDISRAGPGRCVYSHMLNEKGGVVDDVIVAHLARGRYLVVVNAATAAKDLAWMARHAAGTGVAVEDRGAEYAMMAVQGPLAATVTAMLAPAAEALPRFGVLEAELFGCPAIVQRTGYTGEDGFELLVPPDVGARVWEELLTRGRSHGIIPCGLGARDTLRLEAGLLLYGQDIDEEHSPLEAGYAWVVKLDKGDFLGRPALEDQRRRGLDRKLLGVRLLERGVPRPGARVSAGGRELGRLTSATFSPTLQAGIGVGYLPPSLDPGTRVEVEVHGRWAGAEVCATPFYKAPRRGGGEHAQA